MPTRHQKGYVYKKKNRWYVRYYEYIIQEDGSIERKQMARSVAPVCYEYRTKRAVMPLVTELLAAVNSGRFNPESLLSLDRFVAETYLPHVSTQKQPSTSRGYESIWKHHLKPRCGHTRLRDFRTADGEQVIADIARHNDLTRNTLKRIKSFMSGVFKHAKRVGALDGINPMQDVSIPKSRRSRKTYAYSLEDISRMISILPEPGATIVATAAFTGMRKGEIRGLLWDNYHDEAIWVTQSVWERFVTEPKTEQSDSVIPVIVPLAKVLDKHRHAQGDPQTGFVFVSRRNGREGGPINLNSLLKWQIRPS